MVQEATRQRVVYKIKLIEFSFPERTGPKNDILDKYLILYPTFLGEHVPRQKNNFDCGVFCITYADFLTEGFAFSEFSQEHMPILRRKLDANILQVMNFY